MKRKQFLEELIIGIRKEAEAGAVVTDRCRRHGMSSATYYAWKARFGGLKVSSLPFLSAFDPGHRRDDGRQHVHENADTAFQSSRFL